MAVAMACSAPAQTDHEFYDLSLNRTGSVPLASIRPPNPQDEAICRAAFYESPTMFEADRTPDYTAAWCGCMVTDVPLTHDQPSFTFIPRNADFMPNLVRGMQAIAARRARDHSRSGAAFRSLTDESDAVHDRAMAATLNALAQRTTRVFADLSDDGLCNYPK